MTMQEYTCNTCANYRQHYTFDQQKIFRVFCGHCVFPKVKTVRPFKKSCAFYEPGGEDLDAFVSKEFLSKSLLEYMLKLDLLPNIEDEACNCD